jgi:hypothetical protein
MTELPLGSWAAEQSTLASSTPDGPGILTGNEDRPSRQRLNTWFTFYVLGVTLIVKHKT